MAPTRFHFIDSLRGLAALSVVIFHATTNQVPALLDSIPFWIASALRNGHLGVAIFFVLSGFVISHSLHAIPSTFGSMIKFLLRRSVRLAPPYWASIVLVLLFSMISTYFVPDKEFRIPTIIEIISHIFYLQDIAGLHPISPVFWTLGIEVQFYIVYCMAIAILYPMHKEKSQNERYAFLTYAIFVFSSVFYFLYVLKLSGSCVFVFSYLYSFSLGVGVYFAWKGVISIRWFSAYLFVIFVVSIGFGDKFGVTSCVTAFVIWICLNRNLDKVKWFSYIQFLGVVSYSLYLTHSPITGASFRVGYMITGHSVFWELLWWIVSIVACFAFSFLFWLMIEVPSIGFSRKIRTEVGRDGNVVGKPTGKRWANEQSEAKES